MPTIDETREMLRSLPAKKDEANKLWIKARAKTRQLEAEYKIACAKSYLDVTGSVKEREVMAEVANEVLFNEIVKAKGEEDVAKAACDYVEDIFIALRKDTSLTEAEMRHLNY